MKIDKSVYTSVNTDKLGGDENSRLYSLLKMCLNDQTSENFDNRLVALDRKLFRNISYLFSLRRDLHLNIVYLNSNHSVMHVSFNVTKGKFL